MEPGKKRSKRSSGSRRQSSKGSSSGQGGSLPEQLTTISINDYLVFWLNEALSMEKASADRLQMRIMETGIKDSKVQLQHHLEETIEQENRLRQLVKALGGEPTEEKAQLSMPSPPKSLIEFFGENRLSAYSELIRAREDALIEGEEIIFYFVLLQIAQKAPLVDAISPLSQSLGEERSMAHRITMNISSLIEKLQPINSNLLKQPEQKREMIKEKE